MTKKGKNILIWKYHVTLARTKAKTYSSQIIVQVSFSKIKSLPSATSILSRSAMAYNTTVFLDKLACTNYVDFGKSQDRFGRFFWSKNDSNYLDNKLKVFKREDKNAEFRLRQNLPMGKADCNQFIRQRNQLVVAADNFLREQNLSPVLQSTLSKTWRRNWSLFTRWLTLWSAQTERFVWHCWDTRWTTQKLPMPKSVYSDGKKRKKNFSKLCMSTINFGEFLYLLDVMNSVYDKVIAN